MQENFKYVKHLKDNKLHKENGPALIRIDSMTNAVLETNWFLNGEKHRDDGPQSIEYFTSSTNIDKNTITERKITYCKNNKVHRDDGPAIIEYYDFFLLETLSFALKSKQWFKNNELHNDNLPAVIHFSLNKENKPNFLSYFRNGKKHRFNGPADVNIRKGEKLWFVNDKQIDPSKYPIIENNKIINKKTLTKSDILNISFFDREYANFILNFLKTI